MEEEVMSKAEIDTRAPFRSVKEAVMLFGESVVLGTQVYDGKEMQNGATMVEFKNEIGRIDELEEAKQTLRRAREENLQMATSIYFLQQELDQTKIELQRLKGHDHESNRMEQSQQIEFQRKKYVTFADPPCVEQVVSLSARDSTTEPVLRRQASLRKKKMKELIPLIKRIFLRKRESSQVAFA